MSSNIPLTPYLSFNGNCEEALHTYKSILGGNYEIIQRYDNASLPSLPDYKDKILHGQFEFGGNKVFVSDTFPGSIVSGNNIALSLEFENEKIAEGVFRKLSEGGKIQVPFEKQFWGAWHGNLIDRFGIRWMLNVG